MGTLKVAENQNNTDDPLFRLKYIGYILASGDAEFTSDLQTFLDYAKFQICEARGILLKDPIWDKYQTDEDIIVEYYAIRFSKTQELQDDFKLKLQGLKQEDIDWMEQAIVKNRKKWEETKKVAEDLPDEIVFDPHEDK